MQRHSKKRQAILDCLKETHSHPTAEWIYARLKSEYPDLSLGTVYRNLAQLKASGEIASIGIFAGQERFDGFTTPHTHAFCEDCGKIVDIAGLTLSDGLIEEAEAHSGFKIDNMTLVFNGRCAECASKEADDKAI